MLNFSALEKRDITRVLIICAHRPGRSPSQRYRFEQYLSFLHDRGFSFTYSFLLNTRDDHDFYRPGRLHRKALILLRSLITRIGDLRRLKHHDLIFIQRESNFLGTVFFEKIAATRGKPIIFDFDDSIWLADTSPANKKYEWLKRPGKFFDTLSYATIVIAGNRYLAQKAGIVNPNTVLIPTTIDTTFHVPKPELRNRERLIIGWSGSISTLKHFEAVIPVLQRLQAEYGDRLGFALMGARPSCPMLKNIVTIQWTEESEVNTLNTFDIGIMPLPDDEWSLGKCGLKALSYMACGVPAVASSVGANNEIIRNNYDGILAGTEEQWYEALKMLLDDRELRNTIGRRGRETVEERFSTQVNAPKYLQVFERAIQGRR
jgi:glycosyltransferase involved in cell wall biosynthesis